MFKRTKKVKNFIRSAIPILFLIALVYSYNNIPEIQQTFDRINNTVNQTQKEDITPGKIKVPERTSKQVDNSGFDYGKFYEYQGTPFMVVNDNIPNFKLDELNNKAPMEKYAPLDELGRVGVAEAVLTKKMMPTDEREAINSVKPSGWNNKKYDSSLINGGWIYNRCHLIGFQFTGQNANELNLMTGTRAFNVDGMLPFENQVADYIRKGGTVRYRITPVFNGDELVARGIYMEAQSLDTNELSFCVYVFNNQNGFDINYATGETYQKN